MTNEDYEELKRVCRIRGVQEPTEPTAEEFCEAQWRETKQIMRNLAERLRNAAPFVPGPGFSVPGTFLLDGRVNPNLLQVDSAWQPSNS